MKLQVSNTNVATWRGVTVKSELPSQLKPLEELAKNLWWVWNSEAKSLFRDYYEEQFLMMYGMLTGTASTGIILLREIDGNFKTPASDNMVYQNFPAIVFGFPMMFLATLAPSRPYLVLIIFVLFFAGMNILLFRSKIFKKKAKK